MKKKIRIISILLLGSLLSVGCSTKDSQKDYRISEEQKLILYTSHKEEVYAPLVKEFEERTGIWVDVHTGGTKEMLEEIRKDAGKDSCDVMFGGGVESYEAYEEYFQPYACSFREKLDDSYTSPDDRWTIFSELPIVFIYNNKLVNREDAPKSWAEFLTDKWKGQIAFADPLKSGSSYTALATMAQISNLPDNELIEKFTTALDGRLSPGSGDVTKEVGAGIRLVGITLEETARKEIIKGADIDMIYPDEGTSAVPDGCALVKGAPHPENARQFIDFTVSDDVQRLLIDEFCRRSVRKDIQEGTNKTDESEKIRLISFDLAKAGENQEDFLKLWTQTFSGRYEP